MSGSSDDAWDPTAGFLAGDYRPRGLCPRCGSDRAVDYGAQLGCGRCGASWQADADPAVEWPAAGAHRRR